MLSINEICANDHTPEEIKAWGGRTFDQVNRIPAIQNQFYLVFEYACSQNVSLLTLKSSITAFEFYKKYGFIKTICLVNSLCGFLNLKTIKQQGCHLHHKYRRPLPQKYLLV